MSFQKKERCPNYSCKEGGMVESQSGNWVTCITCENIMHHDKDTCDCPADKKRDYLAKQGDNAGKYFRKCMKCQSFKGFLVGGEGSELVPQKKQFAGKKRKVEPSAVPKKHYDDMAAKVLAQEVEIHQLKKRMQEAEDALKKLASMGATGPGFGEVH